MTKATKETQQNTTITLRPEIYSMIEELKKQFAEMTQNPDLTDEDVIAVLINGFIESVEQAHHHSGQTECHGCGAGCGCHNEEDED